MILLFDEAAGESNNQFHRGLNITVRLGDKYSTSAIGSHVLFENLNGDYLNEGELIGIFKLKFGDIADSVLEKEHDPKCRTLEGLRKVLEIVYNRKVEDTDVVCALLLHVS